MSKVDWRQTIDGFLTSIPNHVGMGGFEGLIVTLLEEATGQCFRLSASGPQQGQDASSEPRFGNRVKVEVKHYGKSRLRLRFDLLPGLVEATESDDVDLWVLAASCAVSKGIERSLRRQAGKSGVEVFILDLGNDGLPRLSVLMAAYPGIVESWTKLHHHSGGLRSVLAALRLWIRLSEPRSIALYAFDKASVAFSVDDMTTNRSTGHERLC